MPLTRREFLKLAKRFLTATNFSAVFGPILVYFYPPKLEETSSKPVWVIPEDELKVNESKTVPFGRYPALVINTSAGLRAYSAVCTHFACIVKWIATTGRIECPCHEGFYDPVDGHVISGPPPFPLKALVVNIIDGDIYIETG